ncbi:hypothetical protein KAU33_04555 [Candidatus Dependentiae bacterium]|nr:hypothetical protein [Candidatus Dependentiae bacterium]
MMLILQTPEEEEAIRKGSVTASELIDIINSKGLNPNITIGVQAEN